MAIEVLFIPGATTSNCSLPAWAPDIGCMPTTTVTGWEILSQAAGTTNNEPATTCATAYTTRTFNMKVAAGAKDRWVKVTYNKVNEFVRT